MAGDGEDATNMSHDSPPPFIIHKWVDQRYANNPHLQQLKSPVANKTSPIANNSRRTLCAEVAMLHIGSVVCWFRQSEISDQNAFFTSTI